MADCTWRISKGETGSRCGTEGFVGRNWCQTNRVRGEILGGRVDIAIVVEQVVVAAAVIVVAAAVTEVVTTVVVVPSAVDLVVLRVRTQFKVVAVSRGERHAWHTARVA